MDIRFGTRQVTLGSAQLGRLRESNDLLKDSAALRARFAEDGYLLLRQVIDPAKVQETRATILQFMHKHESLAPGTPVLEGVMQRGGKTVSMLGKGGVTHDPAVLKTFEADELYGFYQTFFGAPVLTFNYKWLRAVGHERFTGAHYDVVYMGRGTLDLMTCWIPIGDATPINGTLAILVGSHSLPSFEKLRRTYGRMDVDRDRVEGWFSDDPLEITEKYGGQWCTTEFRAGDFLTFGMYTMHASTTNQTDRYRLSCDVRFHADQPVDERWIGVQPKVHYAWMTEPEKIKPMAAAKKEWGV